MGGVVKGVGSAVGGVVSGAGGLGPAVQGISKSPGIGGSAGGLSRAVGGVAQSTEAQLANLTKRVAYLTSVVDVLLREAHRVEEILKIDSQGVHFKVGASKFDILHTGQIVMDAHTVQRKGHKGVVDI